MGDLLLMERQTIGATDEFEGTAVSATATTIVNALHTEVDDFWNDSELRIIRGAGVGQQANITDFVAATDTLSFGALSPVPDATSRYTLDRPAPAAELFRAGNFSHSLTVEEIAREIRDSSLSPFARVKGKRSATLSFTTELRGSGAAGTAPDYGSLFKACGMSETIVGGASVTYAPASTPSTFTKTAITAYIDGLRILFMGCMGTFTINAEAGGVALINWEFTAADFKVTDTALVSGSAYDSQAPESALQTAFAFSGHNFDVANISLAMGNNIALRQSANVIGGHITAVVTGRAPAGSFDPEAVLIATENLWGEWEGKTEVALSVQFGQAAGNKCIITAPKCQYGDIGIGDRDAVLTYDAPFSMNRNTGDDEISIAFT